MGGGYTNPHIRDLGQPVVVLHGGLAAAGEAGYVSQAFSRLDNCPCVIPQRQVGINRRLCSG